MRVETHDAAETPGRGFKLISHRGGKGFGPENTMQSLQGALDFGVEMVETDVRMSADGVAVIQHSPFIGLRLLSRMDLGEIRERAPEVPTLREYLELGAKRCEMNLEIKRCDAGVLAATIAAAGPHLNILVSSFDADFLVEFMDLGTGLELGLLGQYELSPERTLRYAARCGASTLLPVSFAVRDTFVDMAHEAGLGVITWTVNSSEQLRDLVEAGVDGVITDLYPELMSFLRQGMMEPDGEMTAAPGAAVKVKPGGNQ